MNFENKLALTTKKYWYSNTEAKPYHASLEEIYGFKIKYAVKFQAELKHYRDEAEKMNLNQTIIDNVDEWADEEYESPYEILAVYRKKDLDYLVSHYCEYMVNGEVDLKNIQWEIEEYELGKNLDLIEIDEKAYHNFCKAQKAAELIKDKKLSELAELYLKNAPSNTFETPATVETKKQENNGLKDFISLALNICIVYVLGLLLLTVVHINSNPISQDLLKKSMEDEHSEIHKAARDYTVNNNSVRLQATRILCLSTTKQFNDRLFDRTDNKACDYFKRGGTVESLLNLDEVQDAAYQNNRSTLLESILITMHLLVLFLALRCLFKGVDE